jgi:hypothetical protein
MNIKKYLFIKKNIYLINIYLYNLINIIYL